jgi:hypothetical protein
MAPGQFHLCAHGYLWSLLELGVEVANAKTRQGGLQAVDDSGSLANEGLALAVGALGILLLKRGDGRRQCG